MVTPTEVLKEPYGRVVFPESDGTFRAEIIEFPGCIATGDTASEALSRLEDVADGWLQSVIERGQRIPEPLNASEFSGKFVVRLPRGLHRRAAYRAAQEGVSLNQFIVSSVAEQVGSAAVRQASPMMSQAISIPPNFTVLSQCLFVGNASEALRQHSTDGSWKKVSTVATRRNAHA